MTRTKIRLSKWNAKGAMAEITDGCMDCVSIVGHRQKQDAKSICEEAASVLRGLADAFDRLSVMEDPFKEKTQKAAMGCSNAKMVETIVEGDS